MELTLFSLFLVISSRHINGNPISGNYELSFFDEYGSHNYERNTSQTFLLLQFQSIVLPTRSLWIKIKRKKIYDYPILVKSSTKKSRNMTTTSQQVSCHFVAASHLMRHPLTNNNQRSAGIPFVDNNHTHIDDLPISLCDGINGIALLSGGKSLVKIESTDSKHPKIVRLTEIPKLSADSLEQLSGYHRLKSLADGVVQRSHKRVKRSFRMPVHQDMPGPFLVELYLIVDSKMASMYNQDNYAKLLTRITSITNQINVAFMQFNIYFTIVQLEIWEQDPIKLTDEHNILLELQHYKRQFIIKRNDCVHAILGENLGSAQRGQAEPSSMCAYNYCVGYTRDHWGLSELEIAHSVMHELGHNFGLSHDTERCQCYGCIMATGVEFGSLKFQWSNCSKEQIIGLLQSGMSDCLRDLPESDLGNFYPIVVSQNKGPQTLDVVTMSLCGNGVVDDGEQCDCGGSDQCSAAISRCCDAARCRFRGNAKCASGTCCDINSCLIKPAAVTCRSSEDMYCDLPEYCDGVSEWCPADVYSNDGLPCVATSTGDKSHCYHGRCRSRGSQCRLLYGKTGYEASSTCYNMNRIGTDIKNCGIVIPLQEDRYIQTRYWKYRACNDDNLMCGRLWCSHENERVLRPSPMVEMDQIVNGYHCSAARFPLNWYFDDAGLVPNGSPCGRRKICWNGLCIYSVYKDMGGCYCHGHGVCNNRGHCHCDPGFAPGNCTEPGNGGSVDSGPLPLYHKHSTMVVAALLIFIVAIVTMLSIVTLLYHYNTRRWPPVFTRLKWPNYQILSRTFKDCGIRSRSRTKHVYKWNGSPTIRLSEPQLCTDKSGNRSDVVLQDCLNRISAEPDQQLSLDELNAVLDNVFMKKSDSSAESKQPARANNYSQFSRSPMCQLNLTKDTKHHAGPSNNHSPLCSPPPPTTAIISDEVIYANIPATTVVNKSPPPKINANKPSQVKSRALMFEKMTDSCTRFQNPRLNVAAPESGAGVRGVSANKEVTESRMKAVQKTRPVVVGVKPSMREARLPATSDHVTDTTARQEREEVATTTSGEGSKRVPSKAQISQPRLEHTTCTAMTRDLPVTDSSLARKVAPHKVITIDPHSAVKYLY